MNTLRLQGIKKIYDPGRSYQVEALRGIDIEFKSGTSYAIMGASGSGKSTLLNILGCLDKPTSGNYFWDDQKIDELPVRHMAKMRAQDIGFILQDYGLLDYISVMENCLAPCVFAGQPRKRAKQNVLQMLKRLEIDELAKREAGKLSGGQKQRAAIARALVNRPQLILADEPTGALDSYNANIILDTLMSLVNSKSILVLATHDEAAARRCDHIFRILDGRIVDETILQ